MGKRILGLLVCAGLFACDFDATYDAELGTESWAVDGIYGDGAYGGEDPPADGDDDDGTYGGEDPPDKPSGPVAEQEEPPQEDLPDGCYLAPGTSQDEAEWLEWWRVHGRDFLDIGDVVNGINACPKEVDLDAIKDKCKDLPTMAERVLCVKDAVHDAIQELEDPFRKPGDDKYVCRHYSKCVEKVLDGIGDSCNFDGGDVWGKGGHAWCEIWDKDTKGTYVCDAYNDICYWVPPEKGLIVIKGRCFRTWCRRQQ